MTRVGSFTLPRPWAALLAIRGHWLFIDASSSGGGGAAVSKDKRARRQTATAEDCARSLARLRRLSDLSWPQAARMSRPRGVRTGA